MENKFLFMALLFMTSSAYAMMPKYSRNFMKNVICTQRAVSTLREVEVGALYKHYKRNEAIHLKNEYLYKIIGIAHHSEDLAKLVVYQALYATEGFPKDSLWTRPYDMFVGDVEVNGKIVSRFEKIEDKNSQAWRLVYGDPEKLDQK